MLGLGVRPGGAWGVLSASYWLFARVQFSGGKKAGSWAEEPTWFFHSFLTG